MKNLILTTVLSLTILSGLQAQETYYEKHVAFPADATVAEKIDMASRLVPTPQQLEWQRMELTAFLHFGVNTFTGREWGDGTEDPAIFNPTSLDCEQWVRTLKESGFKMAIITAKHSVSGLPKRPVTPWPLPLGKMERETWYVNCAMLARSMASNLEFTSPLGIVMPLAMVIPLPTTSFSSSN